MGMDALVATCNDTRFDGSYPMYGVVKKDKNFYLKFTNMANGALDKASIGVILVDAGIKGVNNFNANKKDFRDGKVVRGSLKTAAGLIVGVINQGLQLVWPNMYDDLKKSVNGGIDKLADGAQKLTDKAGKWLGDTGKSISNNVNNMKNNVSNAWNGLCQSFAW